ncbi:unnamed protein product [Sphagnum balticum]
MNAPKREIEFNNLSLEGLEDLLDRIFEPAMLPGPAGRSNDPAEVCYNPSTSPAIDDAKLLSDIETIECRYTSSDDQALPANHRRKANARLRALNEVEVLSNKLKLFRAQLQYALSELDRVKKSEASLRLRLTVAQDRLRLQSTTFNIDEDIAGDALSINQQAEVMG